MVETPAADRADEPFREGILPRASRSREDLSDAHPLHALTDGVTVDRVTVAEEIGRGSVVGEVSTIC